jgi:hypothetical protein
MAFNENSRVKIPAIIHLTRLGYSYMSLKGPKWDDLYPPLHLSTSPPLHLSTSHSALPKIPD